MIGGYSGLALTTTWRRPSREPANHHAWRRRVIHLHYSCAGGANYGAVDFTFKTWHQLRRAFARRVTAAAQILSLFAGGKTRVWMIA